MSSELPAVPLDSPKPCAVSPFVRALTLSCFEEFALLQGINPAEMLRRASLPVELLRRQEGILAYRRFCALLELCTWQSGNPLFGLQYGLHQGVSIFGPLLYLIRNARTVGDALVELKENFALHNAAAHVALAVDDEVAVLSYHIYERDMPGIGQAEELAIGVGMQLMRTLVGGNWLPSAILLRHAPLTDATIYRRTLACNPTFNTACHGLVFPSAVLAQPLSSANETLHQLLTAHVHSMERLSADEMPSFVRQLLRNMLPSGRVTIEKVADCMAINSRTLQRRLAQEGKSFQDLLEETRQTMACEYLEDPMISTAQMAELLGYSDLSAFCRAFQRWFSMTPRAWQKRHCPEHQPRLLRRLRVLR